MIKVLRFFAYKHVYGWVEMPISPIGEDKKIIPLDDFKKKVKPLNVWIEELVGEGHWKIIAATTKYIILQKPNYLG